MQHSELQPGGLVLLDLLSFPHRLEMRLEDSDDVQGALYLNLLAPAFVTVAGSITLTY